MCGNKQEQLLAENGPEGRARSERKNESESGRERESEIRAKSEHFGIFTRDC